MIELVLRVNLIGPPRIETAAGDRREVRGQKSWAVLARLLLSDRPLSRRELSADLFPETVDPMGSLRWCLAGLRKAFADPQVLTGDPVCTDLPPGVVVDVLELLAGRVPMPLEGELLDGVDTRFGPEFSTWLLVAREHVSGRIAAALREDVIVALSRGDVDRALRSAEAGVRRAPFDEGAQVLLVKSLVAAGHEAAALRHIDEVERAWCRELGIGPTPALRSAARRHPAEPPSGVTANAVAAALLESGRAALAAGAIDAGVDCLRQACGRAEAASDRPLLATCLLELGTALVHGVRGFDDEGSVLLGQAAELALDVGARATAAAALTERGYTDALAGRRPEAARTFTTAAEVAGDDAGLLATVHAFSGLNLADWGRTEEAMASYRRADELARRAADERRRGWVAGLAGWALLQAGDLDGAQEWMDDCLALVRQLRWVSFEPWVVAGITEIALGRDEGRPVTEDLERCFAMSCQLEDPCWEGATGRVLALERARRGDMDDALRWIADARSRSRRKSDTWTGLVGAVLLTEMDLRLRAGDAAGAEAAARDAVAIAARAHLDAVLPRAASVLTMSASVAAAGGRDGSAQ